MGREGVAIRAPSPMSRVEGSVLRRPGRLWPSGRAPGPAPGSPEGRPDGPPAGRVEGSVAGCRAGTGQLQGGALCLPWAALVELVGGTWSRLRAVRRTARQAEIGPGSSGAVRCVSLGGSVVSYVSNLDTISAPRSPSNPPTSADFVRLLAVHRVLIYRTRRISHNKIR